MLDIDRAETRPPIFMAWDGHAHLITYVNRVVTILDMTNMAVICRCKI